MNLKRTLQFLLLFCVAFLWMPMTAKAEGNEAKVGDIEYATLEEAISDAQPGETVTLLKGITIGEEDTRNFTINKNLTIDGGNFTITKEYIYGGGGNIYPIFTVSSGEVVMQNITIDNKNQDKASIEVENGAKLSLKDTKIQLASWAIKNEGNLELKAGTNLVQTYDADSDGISAVHNLGYCVMESGNISTNDGLTHYISYCVRNESGGTFTMNGGILNAESLKWNYQTSRVDCLFNAGNTIIDGGTLAGSTQNGIQNESECTIHNMTVKGDKWVNVIVNLTNGTLTVNNANCNFKGNSFLDNGGKAVINGGIYNNELDNFAFLNWNGSGNASLTIAGGTIKSKFCGIFNTENLIMTGGTITGCQNGVQNTDYGYGTPNFEMHGGEIISNTQSGVVNDNGTTFKMYGGEISGNTQNGVDNKGNFAYNDKAIIKDNGGNTPDDNISTDPATGKTENNLAPKEPPVVPTPDSSNEENEVVITDSEGNIVKEPERWVPTTPDEIKRYAFLGKEAVSYNCPKTNAYGIKIINAMQGPKCFVSFEAALGDYTMGRTYNIYPDGKQAYSKDQKATITLSIPKELQKEGRTFKMICVTEGGLPIVLNDLDKNSETITFETDKFYAFALIYK